MIVSLFSSLSSSRVFFFSFFCFFDGPCLLLLVCFSFSSSLSSACLLLSFLNVTLPLPDKSKALATDGQCLVSAAQSELATQKACGQILTAIFPGLRRCCYVCLPGRPAIFLRPCFPACLSSIGSRVFVWPLQLIRTGGGGVGGGGLRGVGRRGRKGGGGGMEDQ